MVPENGKDGITLQFFHSLQPDAGARIIVSGAA